MTYLDYDYTPAVMHALELISQGELPTKAFDTAHITRSIFERVIASAPELQDMAVDAHSRGYDTLADVLLNYDKLSEMSTSDVRVMKMFSENIKWYLSRKDSQRYGERVTVENKFTADKAIVEALSRGKQRVLELARDTIAEDVVAVIVEPNDYSHEDVSEFL